MRQLWHERTVRERWVLAGGTTVLALALAYAYVWLPVARDRDRLISELPMLRAQAQQMRAEASQIEQLRAAAGSVPEDLNAVLTGALAREGAPRATPRISAEPNGRVRVEFTSVSAREWQAWIASMVGARGVYIEGVQVEALQTPGTIRASTLFSSAR